MESKPHSILVIDDDSIMQRLMMTALTKAGYVVRTSSSVSQGLRLIAEEMPDVVLCDIVLPVTTGLDFLRHCRATPELAELPIIIVSSVNDEHQARDVLELGAAAHMLKPFSQTQLLQVVADTLGVKK